MRISVKLITLFWCFLFMSVTLIAQNPGNYTIQSAIAGKHLDVQWGNANSGTPLHLWPQNGGNAQEFILEDAGDGYFYIQSKLGRYLNTPSSSGAQGTVVTIADKVDANHFKWKFIPAGGDYYFIQSKTGTYLDVKNASSENGTPIWMYPLNSSNAQKWKLNPVFQMIISPDVITDIPIINLPEPVTIPAAVWQGLFANQMNQADISVDNYTPNDFEFDSDNTYRYYQPDNSKFSFSSTSGDFEQIFEIRPFRANPLTIYVDDLNFQRARATHENGKVKLLLYFEEEGLEVRTNCIDNFFCGGIGNPNFNLEDPVISIAFEPLVEEGLITYDTLEINFTGHLNHEGFNMTVGPLLEVANMFDFSLDNMLQERANEKLNERFNTPEIKNHITRVINSGITGRDFPGFSLPESISNIDIDANGNLLLYE